MSISFTPGEKCTLTDLSTQKILEYCDFGKKWVNSDFLWVLDQHIQKEYNEEFYLSHYIWGDWQDFVTFEKSVQNDWSDMVSWFKDQNPELKEFLEFYERNVTQKTNPETQCERNRHSERESEYIDFFKRTLVPSEKDKSQPKPKIDWTGVSNNPHHQTGEMTHNIDNDIPF